MHEVKHKETLLKRARSKYLSTRLATILCDTVPGSSLVKAYRNTIYCNDKLTVQEDKHVTATYCKNRWCHVCNRNRTAVLINGYGEQLKEMADAQFVTLTAITVEERQLLPRISQMNQEWRMIAQLAVKQQRNLSGVRKMEITVRPGNRYHPHFHLVVNGKDNAQWIVDQWLKRFGKYAKSAAQDIRRADEKSLQELFKYFTKLTVRAGSKNLSGNLFETTDRQGMRVFIDPSQLDVIFRAIKGRRTYQPFGSVRLVQEEVDEKKTIKISDDLLGKIWTWVDQDWISEHGEFLTGYEPGLNLKQLFEGMGT